MDDYEFETPILFLTFNRFDVTKKVFEKIKEMKPKQLFLASDGWRNDDEEIDVKIIRRYLLHNIDWNCDVRLLFRDSNLGCKKAVSSAIDWFFDNVEQGIILEDDCLPDTTFFRYCEELLDKYKDNEKIISINGTNQLRDLDTVTIDSYCFSKYFFCWGWATWRRAWKKYDNALDKFRELEQQNKLKEFYPGIIERKLRIKRVNDSVNSWAIQFSLAHQLNKCYSVIPEFNLVENIGFIDDSTHTKPNKWDKKFLNIDVKPMNFPLRHPEEVEENTKFFRLWITHDVIRATLKRFFK